MKYPLFLSYFNKIYISSTDCIEISNFTKILQVAAELFRADRQTDTQTDEQINMTKLIVAFRNFKNAPIRCGLCLVVLCTALVTISPL